MYREEVFGPVAGLFRVGSAEEAVALANDTEFGLGANAWTNDEDERDLFVRDLAAGAVFINGMVTSYPELPFGGIKTSGYGRELSAQGIRAFCNLKTVWVGRRLDRGAKRRQAEVVAHLVRGCGSADVLAQERPLPR